MPLPLLKLLRQACPQTARTDGPDRRSIQSAHCRVQGVRLGACVPLLLSGLMSAGPIPAADGDTSPTPEEYRLHLHHTHTGESLDVVYKRSDTYLPDGIARLEHFLRDHRTGDVHHFDARLFDLLADLMDSIGRPDAVIEVICGYRAPGSNTYLRRTTSGVAGHSLHMQAQAIDIRIEGVKTSDLRDAALSLHRGGVGYYPRSDFVHVDVGRVRRW
jgi:uncharacterized protein YcbK (DUF882 family)